MDMLEHAAAASGHIDNEDRADLRSAADLRRLALQEERLAEAADLPRVRDKHRMAARSWSTMAKWVERAERLRA